MVVPIRLSTTSKATTNDKATISNDNTTSNNNNNINASVPILSAKILAIYTNNIQNTDTNNDIHNIKSDFSNDISSSGDGDDDNNDNNIYVDVEYICDNIKENKILIKNRLVLSTDKGDPSILLSLFIDLIKQISTIIPSRYDLQQQMFNMIQSTLSSSTTTTIPTSSSSLPSSSNKSTYLYEVLSNHLSYQPKTELLPLLLYFINILKELQSLPKVIILDKWINEINELFLKEPVIMDDIILYLPTYFEKAMLIIEDIKYDVS